MKRMKVVNDCLVIVISFGALAAALYLLLGGGLLRPFRLRDVLINFGVAYALIAKASDWMKSVEDDSDEKKEIEKS